MRALDSCLEPAQGRAGRGTGDLAAGSADADRGPAPVVRPCRFGFVPVARGLAIALAAVVSAPPAAAEPGFPAEARVTVDQAYVRSGPGPSFYPTDKLARGDTVEIYRRDPGDWYAVRPPRGSFTWVAARYVELGGDGLGTVAEENVPARVGSRFSTIREVIQVRLQRGETVEIVGRRDFRGATWYKIEPPSGEFRWLAGSDLDVAPAEEEADEIAAGGPAADNQESVVRDDQPVGDTPARDEFVDRAASAETPPVRTAAAQDADARGPTEARLVPIRRPEDRRRSPAGWRGTSAPDRRDQADIAVRQAAHATEVAEPARPAEPARQPRPEATADRNEASPEENSPFQLADRLEQELSIMVAEEPTVWEFGEIKRSAKLLVDEGATAVDRSRGRKILRKIERFEDIKRRHDRAGAVVLDDGPRRRREAAPGAPPLRRQNRQIAREWAPVPTRSAARPGPGFDGTGTLRPVVSRRQGAPRYALVDATGAVVSFVTPAPGVNLQPYIGRKIGVRGTRGYMPQYRRAHVTAQNVTELAQRWLR